MEKILECAICGQGFLFEMDNTICGTCEDDFERKLEAERIEDFRADLFDETTSDLIHSQEMINNCFRRI